MYVCIGFWVLGNWRVLRKYARVGGAWASLGGGRGRRRGGAARRRGQGAEQRFGNPHALRRIPIGMKRVSPLAVSRDNVRASPGRVRRRPEGRPSLILKSKAENLFGQFGERPAIGKSERRAAAAIGRVQMLVPRSATDPSVNRFQRARPPISRPTFVTETSSSVSQVVIASGSDAALPSRTTMPS